MDGAELQAVDSVHAPSEFDVEAVRGHGQRSFTERITGGMSGVKKEKKHLGSIRNPPNTTTIQEFLCLEIQLPIIIPDVQAVPRTADQEFQQQQHFDASMLAPVA